MSFFILLFLREWSPVKFILISGVVESIPIISLASVPELPKFNSIFFFAENEPRPFPYTIKLPFFFKILTPNFLRQMIVEITSSDSSIFFIYEIFFYMNNVTSKSKNFN